MTLNSYLTIMQPHWDTKKHPRKPTREEMEELRFHLAQREGKIQQLGKAMEEARLKMEGEVKNREQARVEYESRLEKYQMEIEALTNENMVVQEQLQEKKKGEMVYIHPEFRDRIFEVCCMISLESHMFGQITKEQQVEEKVLRLKELDKFYKNSSDAMKKSLERDAKKKAIELFEDYYKSHGIFIVYGNVENLLSDNRSKVLGLEEKEEELLERMVPGRLFLDETSKEYLKAISVMDGAVCVDPFGIVQAAGRYLVIDRELTVSDISVTKGFGTKNVTAQFITDELDNIVACTISGRSKLVRQFEHGAMIQEFNPIKGILTKFENGEIMSQYKYDIKSYFKGSEEINEHIDLIYQIMEEQLGKKNKEIVEAVMQRLHKTTQQPHISAQQFYLSDGKRLDLPGDKQGKGGNDQATEDEFATKLGAFDQKKTPAPTTGRATRRKSRKKSGTRGDLEITT